MFVALETTCPRIELREFDIDMDSTYIYIYVYIYIYGTPPEKSTFFMGKGGSIYIYIFDVLEV